MTTTPHGHVTLRCQHATCGRSFHHPRGRGRYPSYCSTAHRKAGRTEYLASRDRSYEKCSHCSKIAELTWGGREYCSPICFGVASLMAQGETQEAAEVAVAALITNDPVLASRRPVRRPGAPEDDPEKYGFTKRSLRRLDAHEMYDGYSVQSKSTYLGGDLGPDEGRTRLGLYSPNLKDHEWFKSHPGWWKS
ncbi:hypothetical protein J2853_006768 [Streptosporangium lutulentum]|uniref:Uncharacterized protein n=1 Tax=Streptosporangium lutulentum TaxID=1461250 RepID=A0ABT9QLC3_9ACTN|nr:hypothetical protein [Streptosporangium lutulentum]